MNEFEAEQRARKFVRETDITEVPVDLSRYLKKFSGLVSLDELDPEESGYTMVTAKGPLITLNAFDCATRRRFTQCHEIAHLELELPSDHSHGPEWSYARRPLNEICCDVFAAELLLPFHLFIDRAKGRPIDFETVDYLRKEFIASREATASRLASKSNLACGYVLSEGGKVQHLVRSTPMRNANAWILRGSPLPIGSAAYDLRAGVTDSGNRTLAGDVWFEGWGDIELCESSVFIPDFDQTLTLLCCMDQDELDALPRRGATEQPDEDDALLKPLDGQLQWPGKRRRK